MTSGSFHGHRKSNRRSEAKREAVTSKAIWEETQINTKHEGN
jgi:hypothetical protein